MEVEAALKEEVKTLKDVLTNVRAEKEAIDQVALNTLQDNIRLRTEVILLKGHMSNKDNLLVDLNNRLAALESDLLALENDAHDLVA